MVLEKLKPLLNNSDKATDNELMTVEEVAKYLKVKRSFIYDKIQRKQIPYKKVGKFPRFRRKTIDKWMRNPYSPELEMNNSNFI